MRVLAALIVMAAYSAAHPHTDDSECADFFLDGKENACSDYISNVDVSLGQGSSCSTLFCEVGPLYDSVWPLERHGRGMWLDFAPKQSLIIIAAIRCPKPSRFSISHDTRTGRV